MNPLKSCIRRIKPSLRMMYEFAHELHLSEGKLSSLLSKLSKGMCTAGDWFFRWSLSAYDTWLDSEWGWMDVLERGEE